MKGLCRNAIRSARARRPTSRSLKLLRNIDFKGFRFIILLSYPTNKIVLLMIEKELFYRLISELIFPYFGKF